MCVQLPQTTSRCRAATSEAAQLQNERAQENVATRPCRCHAVSVQETLRTEGGGQHALDAKKISNVKFFPFESATLWIPKYVFSRFNNK